MHISPFVHGPDARRLCSNGDKPFALPHDPHFKLFLKGSMASWTLAPMKQYYCQDWYAPLDNRWRRFPWHQSCLQPRLYALLQYIDWLINSI